LHFNAFYGIIFNIKNKGDMHMSNCEYGGVCINLKYPNCDICCKGVTLRKMINEENYEKNQREETEKRNLKADMQVRCIKDTFVHVSGEDRSVIGFNKTFTYPIISNDGELCIFSEDKDGRSRYYLPSPTRPTATWQGFDEHFVVIE
jgi:hypothetical protein